MSVREEYISLAGRFSEEQLKGVIGKIREMAERLDEEADCDVLDRDSYPDDEEDMAFCVAAYDEAEAADDGYRISAEDLRRKYGL